MLLLPPVVVFHVGMPLCCASHENCSNRGELTLHIREHIFDSSLGVHISFVRSIAMDSWTEQQLQIMKGGGNAACNEYLQSKSNGSITARTPIRQKYDNPHAQLYKEVLKARVAGLPEPTSLPPPKVRPQYEPNPQSQQMNSISSNGMTMMNGGQPHGSTNSNDPNGMERIMGETDEQYVARQTRLREEAKTRMAAKFGSGGLSSSSGGRMQGIGSDSRYNPSSGGYGSSGGNDFDVSSLVTGFGSVLGSAMNTAKSLADEQTLQAVKSTGASFWGGLTSTMTTVAASITAPNDADDGLAQLQREFSSQKSAQPSKYGGFGSDSATPTRSMNGFTGSSTMPSQPQQQPFSAGSGSLLQEATGLPHEDRNGIERLTGESDEQYVMRQTRLRDEAKARMAAKFGNGGLSSSSGVGSNSTPNRGMATSNVPAAPSSGGMNSNNFYSNTATPTGLRSAPSSGNNTAPPPPKLMNSNDFFSSFGS